MEAVGVVVAAEAVAFVIAFGAALAVGQRAVVVAGLVIVSISAFIASVLARGGEGSWFDFSPFEAMGTALLVGLFLFVGWGLGAAAATRARSWAARRG